MTERASPSASALATVTERTVVVAGDAWSIVTEAIVGAEFATVSESDVGVPLSSPSCGVTSTVTTWPLSPSPAPERSSVSVSELEPAVVLRVAPSTFQTYVSKTVSPSESAFVAVAVRTWFVVGAAGARETVAAGAVFAIATALEVSGEDDAPPSPPVTRTVSWSPLSPSPTWERSRVDPVAPARSAAFRRHWYA